MSKLPQQEVGIEQEYYKTDFNQRPPNRGQFPGLYRSRRHGGNYSKKLLAQRVFRKHGPLISARSSRSESSLVGTIFAVSRNPPQPRWSPTFGFFLFLTIPPFPAVSTALPLLFVS